MDLGPTPIEATPFPAWLDAYISKDGGSLISPSRPYRFVESEYDPYYAADPAEEVSGRGLVGLLRRCGSDFDGPVLEVDCCFRPEQVQAWAQAAGLVTRYFTNYEFEDFAVEPIAMDRIRFDRFMKDYLNYCMGYGAAALMAPLRPYTAYLARACGGTREPQLMGVFLLQRPAGPAPA